MFLPKGNPVGAPPARGLRDIRRDVGTTRPDPAVEEPRASTASVSTTCPECGARVEQTFTADAQDAPAPPIEGSPLSTSGGGPV